MFMSIICIALSFFVFIQIITDENRPHGYRYLYLLPFSFIVGTVIIAPKFDKLTRTTPAIIAYALYFIRNVVTVFVMSIGNYSGYYQNENSTRAILLVSYEVIAVSFVLRIALNRVENNDETKYLIDSINEWVNRKPPIVFSVIMFAIIGIMLVTYIRVPAISSLYVSLFSFDGSLVTESISGIANGGNRSWITLFSFFSDFMRILLPICLFRIIYKQFKGSKAGLIISLPILLLQLMFITATSALAIFCAFVDLYVLIKLYPQYEKRMIRFLYFTAITIVAILFVIKFNSSVLYTGNGYEALSEMMQAYFSGICNVAASYNVPTGEKWNALFFDLYYTIPFNGSLFGLSGTTSANLFNSSNFGKFQIIPCIGQAYFYFGTLLAPIIPCTMVYFSIRVFHKNISEENIWMYASKTLLWLYLCISPIMYNGQIFLCRATNTIIPCIFITYFAKNYANQRKYQ